MKNGRVATVGRQPCSGYGSEHAPLNVGCEDLFFLNFFFISLRCCRGFFCGLRCHAYLTSWVNSVTSFTRVSAVTGDWAVDA